MCSVYMYMPARPQPVVLDITPYSLSWQYNLRTGSQDFNLTLASPTNPRAPPELRLRELNGSLMAHRMCDGSLIPPEHLAVNRSL